MGLKKRWRNAAPKTALEKASSSHMFFKVSIAEIKNMTTKERLKAMEALWDALCHDAAEPESPEWHKDVLAERRHKIESGEATFISLEEAKRRLQE